MSTCQHTAYSIQQTAYSIQHTAYSIPLVLGGADGRRGASTERRRAGAVDLPQSQTGHRPCETAVWHHPVSIDWRSAPVESPMVREMEPCVAADTRW